MLILKGLTLMLALFIFAVLVFAASTRGYSSFSPTYFVSGGAFLIRRWAGQV